MIADFEATDAYSEIVLTPLTKRARDWAAQNGGSMYFSAALHAAPGYMMHHVLPDIRAAGLTVDGDIDDHGRVKIRIRSLP